MAKDTLIRIVAVCDFFEIDEIIPESKSVRRLENLKKYFQESKSHFGNIDAKLKVTTSVVNPELIGGGYVKLGDLRKKKVA